MSGIDFSGGKIVITNGSRVVSTTDGTLLQFLTGEVEYNTTLTFPDPAKRQIYQWGGAIQTAPGGYFATRVATAGVGAVTGTTTTSFNISTKTAGADIFIGRVEFTRTQSPSHGWIGQPISPLLPQSVPIQMNGGSMIVESAFGIMRAVTFRVNDTHLVMERQQSIGPTAIFDSGGIPVTVPSTSIPPNNINRGFENIAVGGATLPVHSNAVLQEQDTFPPDIFGAVSASSFIDARRYGGSSPVPYSDPTNYTSVYSVRIRGRYGRRS